MTDPDEFEVENAASLDAIGDPEDSLDPLTLRMAEAILFAAKEPVTLDVLASRLPEETHVRAVIEQLRSDYRGRGVELVQVADAWRFRTADDLAFALESQSTEERKLSRAALETLAIVAYHQPVTRAEIEEIRGVSTSKGVMDTLLEAGFIKLRGRRRTPGRPVTFGTTPAFLDQFGLASVDELPGIEELKSIGLLDRAGRDPNPFRGEPEDTLDIEAELDADLALELEREAAFGEDDRKGDDDGSSASSRLDSL